MLVPGGSRRELNRRDLARAVCPRYIPTGAISTTGSRLELDAGGARRQVVV